MVKRYFLALLPLFIWAETSYYGEDPFTLGMSIDAYVLGNIRALPMSSPSPGANAAAVTDQKLKIGLQHTEGFGGIYQTDVFSGRKSQWSFLVFRGGVSGIPDTRNSLLDYGTDGIAGTFDVDGTEDNGEMDPGERLSINSISFFSTAQYLMELAYAYPLKSNLIVHGTARLLYSDLYSESGLGVGFHGGLLYEPIDRLHLGLQVTDLLTTTLFWRSGLTETYAPQIYAGIGYRLGSEQVPFAFHPVVQVEFPLSAEQAGLNKGSWGYAGGIEIIFQNQLFIQLGRTSFNEIQLGARVHTRFLDIQYGTGFSELSDLAGQTHRLGVGLQLGKLKLFQ